MMVGAQDGQSDCDGSGGAVAQRREGALPLLLIEYAVLNYITTYFDIYACILTTSVILYGAHQIDALDQI